jgi:mRNA interferase RelE/StbE
VCAESRPYTIVIRPSAKRDLRKLRNNRQVLQSVDATIQALATDPRPHGVEKLGGNEHRVRDGDYRVLYEIDDKKRTVDVYRIRDRKDVYKK